MASKPAELKGPAIGAVATVVVKEEKLELALPLIKKLQDHCNSDAEPGCLVFNLMRFGRELVGTELYASAAAMVEHRQSEAFKALSAADVFESVSAKFYEAF